MHLGLAEGAFDTVIFMGSNLGIGGTPEGVRRLLASLLPITTPEVRGLCSSGGAISEADLTPEELAPRRHNLAKGRYVTQDRFRVTYGEYDTGGFYWIRPLRDDLRKWAERVGWRITRQLSGADYGDVSRLAVVMEKIR